MDWPKLDELDDAFVTAAYEYITQLIRERHPDADAQRGLLGHMVTELHAILHGSVRTVIQQLHDSLSVKAVMENPSRAKSELVDKLIENVGMSRKYVDVAVGRVLVVLQRPVRISVVRGAVFTCEAGHAYNAVENMTFREPDVALKQHEQRLQLHGSRFACSIPVRAVASGTAPPKSGTRFFPAILPPGFAEAYADGDFKGSYCLQDDVDALRLLRVGMTAPGFSNRAAIEALIFRADPKQYRFVADIETLNIVGSPGLITIEVTARPRVDAQNLVSELQAYLDEASRTHLTATVKVEVA